MPPAGLLLGCPPREAAMPPAGHYVNAHYNYSPAYNAATCQTLCHCFQFTAVPLARLYATVFSLQPCHLPDFMPLFSVYSRATCQTLCHCFQFTAVPLARLYFIGSSLQPCHWSDFISLVSVYSRATCQTLFHWFQFTLVRLYFIGFSPDTCQTLFHSFSLQSCCLSDFIALVSVYSPATYQTIALLSVYNAATCQTLLHWFQFTARPIATLYCIGFSLQPGHLPDYCIIISLQRRHLSDFIALVSVYSRANCHTLLHWFQLTVLPLVRLYSIGSS